MNKHSLIILCLVMIMVSVACGAQTSPTTPETESTPLITVTATPTAVPSDTPIAVSSETPSPAPTETHPPTLEVDLTQQAIEALPVLTIEPVVHTDLNSPVQMRLPDDWIVDYEMAAIPMPFEDAINLLPFSAYHGPVTGGQAYIIYLWGFSNVLPAVPLEGESNTQVNLWADGYRLLVTFVLQPDCRVGRDPERTFSVGEYEAVGGYFWAVDCGKMFEDDEIPESPDVQGWFAVFQESGVNFAFYTYVEPREALAGPAREEMQAILDTAEIDFSRIQLEEDN